MMEINFECDKWKMTWMSRHCCAQVHMDELETKSTSNAAMTVANKNIDWWSNFSGATKLLFTKCFGYNQCPSELVGLPLPMAQQHLIWHTSTGSSWTCSSWHVLHTTCDVSQLPIALCFPSWDSLDTWIWCPISSVPETSHNFPLADSLAFLPGCSVA